MVRLCALLFAVSFTLGCEEDSDNGNPVDVDPCLTDNGGCGDPSGYVCTNNEGAAPTCEMVACSGNESWIGDG